MYLNQINFKAVRKRLFPQQSSFKSIDAIRRGMKLDSCLGRFNDSICTIIIMKSYMFELMLTRIFF